MKKLKLEELERDTVDSYKLKDKLPLVVVLDNVRSAMNVGSIFRTSDAFLVEKICLCGITATPPNREITKTAIGATESVEWEYFDVTAKALEALKSGGYQLIGVEQTDSSVMLYDFSTKPEGKYALVLGNEVEGVDEELLPMLDACIEIPQEGTKHSLNVSVCAGIVIYHFYQGLK
ncbi:MAG: RNA methyltransferase [Saprospiraceae bacterium]|nr:RNA methyltransferase [Saprospiraceae bacterium]